MFIYFFPNLYAYPCSRTRFSDVFDGYLPGGEAQYGSVHLASTAPDSIGLQFYEYLVYNDTNWDWESLTYADAVFFEELNPGQMIANSHDLTEFAGESHNGKVRLQRSTSSIGAFTDL